MTVQGLAYVPSKFLDVTDQRGRLVVERSMGTEVAQALVVLRGSNRDDVGRGKVDARLLYGVHTSISSGGVYE